MHTVFFISGWVQVIKHINLPGVFLAKCCVRPSYRTTDEPHQPWLGLGKQGNVIAAHCTCMAG